MSYKARIYTLGCKVNQYESEAIAEALEKEGFEVVGFGNADVCIINTCTVTAESDRKSRQTIRRAITANPEAAVIVTGCYAQMKGEKVSEIAGVDFVCGNREKMVCVRKALELAGGKHEKAICQVESLEGAGFEDMDVSRSERTRAYIKIEDGCENHCSYCIIPSARGKIRSKSPEKVLAEAKRLRGAGYHELVLTGIEVAAYGKDLEEKMDIGELVCMIAQNTDFERISFGSLEPSMMRKSFVDRIAALSSISKHFHLSLQSGCDATLRGMKRKYNTSAVAEYVEYIREKIDDATFTADIIVGFPGETEEDFENTCRFVAGLDLLDAHVFAYSRREGTVADKMPCQIEEQEKSRRSAKLIGICKEKKIELLRKIAQSGAEKKVLFETYEKGVLKGRLENYVEILVASPCDLSCTIQNVKITGCEGEVLLGELV